MVAFALVLGCGRETGAVLGPDGFRSATGEFTSSAALAELAPGAWRGVEMGPLTVQPGIVWSQLRPLLAALDQDTVTVDGALWALREDASWSESCDAPSPYRDEVVVSLAPRWWSGSLRVEAHARLRPVFPDGARDGMVPGCWVPPASCTGPACDVGAQAVDRPPDVWTLGDGRCGPTLPAAAMQPQVDGHVLPDGAVPVAELHRLIDAWTLDGPPKMGLTEVLGGAEPVCQGLATPDDVAWMRSAWLGWHATRAACPEVDPTREDDVLQPRCR